MLNCKYSIIIPTLNGYEGLKVIVPYMLRIDRKDFEIVISINNSNDKSLDFIKNIKDDRVKYFVPQKNYLIQQILILHIVNHPGIGLDILEMTI